MLQEKLLEQDPSGWRMLIGCILLDKSRRTHYVDEVAETVFDLWPTPEDLRRARREDLEIVLQPLGLGRRSSSTLVKLSEAWVGWREPPRTIAIGDMPGCGQYAVDSWRIFILRDLDFVPGDNTLKAYLEPRVGRPRTPAPQ